MLEVDNGKTNEMHVAVPGVIPLFHIQSIYHRLPFQSYNTNKASYPVDVI